MPMGWTTTSWPCLTQLKTYVELCPATLTSISTLMLDRFGSRRPCADACGSARLRSTLSVAIFGGLAAAAVMHARSSTETSCAAAGSRTRSLLRRRWPLAVRLNASEHKRSPRLLPGSEAHIAFVDKADRASRIERVGIENLLIRHATRIAGRLIAGRCDDPDCRSASGGTRRTGRTSG